MKRLRQDESSLFPRKKFVISDNNSPSHKGNEFNNTQTLGKLQNKEIKITSLSEKKEKIEEEEEQTEEEYSLTPVREIVCKMEKRSIVSFLEKILHVEPSDLILTDILFDKERGILTVVGRPKVPGSSSKQMNHVIPFAFVKNLIQSAIDNAKTPQTAFAELSKIVLFFAKTQEGYALSQKDLQSPKYADITPSTVGIANREMSVDNVNINLYSPKRGGNIKWTPKRKKIAEEDFASYNTQFIKYALQKFSEALNDHDQIIANMASDALARFIFIMFNQAKHVAFPKEGNTANYEIRLYRNKKQAEKAGKNYKVVSAKQLKEMDTDQITECIRLVDCEGSKVKNTIKVLELLDGVIKQFNCYKTCDKKSIDIYNSTYNYQLSLANSDYSIKKYNTPITKQSYQKQLPYHIAKLLYGVFDLKSLEETVIVPDRRNGELTVYNSASGKRTSKYSFDDGDEFRKDEIEGARGYSSNEVFRNKKTDKSILASKITELFVIGTKPFKSINEGLRGQENSFLKSILKKLATLATCDYQMNKYDTKIFEKDVTNLYENLISTEPENYELVENVEVIGSDFGYLLHQ